MKQIPKTVIFVIVIFAGGIGITMGLEFIFETFDVPYNEQLAENRVKRVTEPIKWIEDKISGGSP